MNELVKITQEQIGSEYVDAVNARELWEFLDSKQEFTAWIKNRLKKVGFMEGRDFCSFDNFIKRAKGSSVAKEYFLTMDTAKHIALMEGSVVGHKTREYFIEVEKEHRQPKELPRKKLLQLALEAEEEKERLEAQIKADAPYKDYAIQTAESEDLITIQDVAQSLGTGDKTIYKMLREKGVMHYRKDTGKTAHNVPYQSYVDRGFFVVKTRPGGKGYAKYPVPYATGEGEQLIHQLWSGGIDQPEMFRPIAKRQNSYFNDTNNRTLEGKV